MRRAAGAIAIALLVAACGGDGDDETTAATTTTEATGDTTTSTEATAGEPQASDPDLEAVAVTLTEVARLDAPLGMALLPGGDVLVAQKGGQVTRLPGEEQVLDLSGEVSRGGEQGLLGIAVHPDGDRLYLSYTNTRGDSEVHEWALDGDGTPDEDSRRPLFDPITQPATNHNGGHIAFGPDGLLWYGLGDGGASGDRFGNGQDPDALLGSMLTIDVDAGGPPTIVMKGVRNPWRWSFDRETGDLWIGDVGQNAIEEIDLVPAGTFEGTNLGWPVFEGLEPYDGGDPPAGYLPPVHQYTHEEGISVVGGVVYRGSAIPALRGAYLFADTYTGFVRAIVVEDGQVTQERQLFEVPDATFVSFGEDADGEVWLLGLSGTVSRIDPA